MKKLFLSTILVLATVSLFGCGQKDPEPNGVVEPINKVEVDVNEPIDDIEGFDAIDTRAYGKHAYDFRTDWLENVENIKVNDEVYTMLDEINTNNRLVEMLHDSNWEYDEASQIYSYDTNSFEKYGNVVIINTNKVKLFNDLTVGCDRSDVLSAFGIPTDEYYWQSDFTDNHFSDIWLNDGNANDLWPNKSLLGYTFRKEMDGFSDVYMNYIFLMSDDKVLKIVVTAGSIDYMYETKQAADISCLDTISRCTVDSEKLLYAVKSNADFYIPDERIRLGEDDSYNGIVLSGYYGDKNGSTVADVVSILGTENIIKQERHLDILNSVNTLVYGFELEHGYLTIYIDFSIKSDDATYHNEVAAMSFAWTQK